MTETIPTPGSEAALDAGCECPIHANNWGNFEPSGGWLVAADCPVHDAPKGDAP